MLGPMARQPRRSEPARWSVASSADAACCFGSVGMGPTSALGFCDPRVSAHIGSENYTQTAAFRRQPMALHHAQQLPQQPGCGGAAAMHWRLISGGGGGGGGGPLRDISNMGSQQACAHSTADLKFPAPKQPPMLTCRSKAPSTALSLDVLTTEGEDAELAAQYVPDMIDQLFRTEFQSMPNPSYMDSQAEVNGRMRAILIDWLIDVHSDYRMKPETLFLTVSLIDRYLAKRPVARSHLQLVGVVGLLVAAKFEELHPPTIENLVHITDNAYTTNELKQTECRFLVALDFQVMSPTPVHFLQHLQSCSCGDAFQRELSQYILELGLLDLRLIRHEPSRLASAALLLANQLAGRIPAWPRALARISRHCATSLEEVAGELRVLVEGAPSSQMQAARKKYSKDKHHSVATMIPGPR
mmetsp:Transcript_2883/g.8586  ORF Transcript_2883/g.8586 Transcript_2883/m.8586 type:complete len:414 (+) Transcript_2883:64-1305(+)